MVAFSNIVVVGGGIIGNSVAFYLAKRGISCTIVDPVGIAPAASAKAGGFLARDWRDQTELEQLQRTSFDLHAELATELEHTDYRRLTCIAAAVQRGRTIQRKPSGKKLQDVEWVDVGLVKSYEMGDETTIAQVHPKKLCNAMWEYSETQAGSKLHIGRVVEAIVDENSDDDDNFTIKGVRLEDGTILEADALVVACGPWTDEARSWFPPQAKLPRMISTKCHSILVSSPKRVLNQAVFYEGGDNDLDQGDIEVYPRPDGDAYVNGFADEPGFITERPGQEVVRQEEVERLKDVLSRSSTELGGIEPHTTQACYWPDTLDGLPIIGPIPCMKGAFVASGHSVWGILQGPATGLALSELLLDGKSTALDLQPFRVERFEESVDDL